MRLAQDGRQMLHPLEVKMHRALPGEPHGAVCLDGLFNGTLRRFHDQQFRHQQALLAI